MPIELRPEGLQRITRAVRVQQTAIRAISTVIDFACQQEWRFSRQHILATRSMTQLSLLPSHSCFNSIYFIFWSALDQPAPT